MSWLESETDNIQILNKKLIIEGIVRDNVCRGSKIGKDRVFIHA
jgi:hypothetical protein